MQTFALFLCVALVFVSAEPPNFRNQRFSKSSKQVASPDVETLNPGEASGPYPPSGWKPQGQRFELPPRKAAEETTPAMEYGAPVEVYGAPAEVYGPPTTPSMDTTTEVEDVTTDQPQDESADLRKQNDQGAFYVLLPNSRLQRLVYDVQSNPEKKQYSAKYQSTGVQQLDGPLLVYTPQIVQVL